jgi:hypothetical protein
MDYEKSPFVRLPIKLTGIKRTLFLCLIVERAAMELSDGISIG